MIARLGEINRSERVPIPDDLVPEDARVEIEAKKAAGYYAPDRAADAEMKSVVGRKLDEF